jgi:F0F1-type ATP synthase membrane subunit a
MSKLYSFPNTLPDQLIDSISEPKVHSTVSDIINFLPDFNINFVIIVVLTTICIVLYFFTNIKNFEMKAVIKNINNIIDYLVDLIKKLINKCETSIYFFKTKKENDDFK